MAGWGCCACQHFNLNERTECRYCGHARCDTPKEIAVTKETKKPRQAY